MSKTIKKPTLAHVGTALLLCSTLALTACSGENGEYFTEPDSNTFYQRYPIEVRTAPTKVGVVSRTGSLTPEQVNAVTNFAADARNNAVSTVSVKWPSGSSKMRQVAAETVEIMVDQGVPKGMIRTGSYPGDSAAPLQMTFERKVAVTRECGDWSDNLAFSPLNDHYRNFGCAYQHNMAAVVANPEDFERPRASSPAVAAHRTAAMVIYYKSPTVVTSSSTTTTSISNSSTNTSSGSGD